MSSRGYFVGQVIDDLDAIASQVRQRCKLGQTDLNRVLEDFFKEVLNLVYRLNLQNLNKDRMNEPGLDLGDKAPGARIAYQITSQATAKKVNETLKKITSTQAGDYEKFCVLIIGERQGSYGLDATLCAKYNFSEANIIGITELCRDIMDLPLTDLQAVHRKLADEQRRIRIELEPEMPDGTYKTSVLQFIESRPTVTRSDATAFAAHDDVVGLFDDPSEAAAALDGFIDELARLPRLTREFFGWMIDESDQRTGLGAAGLELNADYLDAKCRNMPNFMAEVRLLRARGFIDFDQEERHESGVFRIWFPGAQKSNLEEGFIYFREALKFSASTLFSTMNFSIFGPPPAKAAIGKPSRGIKPKQKGLGKSGGKTKSGKA